MVAGDGSRNEDWHAYGADVLAVADGTVIAARDDMPDETPFQAPQHLTGPGDDAGNHVTIEIAPGVDAFFAHLAPGSAAVAAGDTVEAGDVIGHLGNAGSTGGPHLHFGLLDYPDPVDHCGITSCDPPAKGCAGDSCCDSPLTCSDTCCDQSAAKCCGDACCTADQTCSPNPGSSSCCNADQVGCGDSCCDTSTATCCGHTCCNRSNQICCSGGGGECCDPATSKCCGNHCCLKSAKCCGDSCCDNDQMCCGNSCCDPVTTIFCAGDSCCTKPSTDPCGGVCCQPDLPACCDLPDDPVCCLSG
ncbi:MAG TPA: M23 family metallopeptidase [Thermomicrobiales bacterium]|nr:M23 family metallopeptidase [Thermomicrobiales bacterium]